MFKLKITFFHLIFQQVKERLLGFAYCWKNEQDDNGKTLMLNIQKRKKKYYQPSKSCKNA